MPRPPLLTLVLVVRRHQAWVRSCLRSILDQKVTGIEVIVVDDASSDHGPEIVDAVAAGDARVHVHRVDDRQGLAKARDAGLELATGDYVWFVDTADYLPPGSLAAVARRLTASAPDVLVVNYVDRDVFGTEQHDARALDTPYLLWNKVFRRRHLQDKGLRFAGGGCAEVGVTYPALATAATIEGLPDVAYCHRRLPRAVRRQWSDGSPLDVFGQYDAVLAALDAGPTGSRRMVLDGMLRHYQALFADLPANERSAFVDRMSRSCRAHGGRDLGGTARQVERLNRAVGRRPRLGRRFRRVKRLLRPSRSKVRTWWLHRYYEAQLRQPINDRLAVFAAYWYTAYSCNPRAIYEKARELAPWLECVWVVNADAAHVVPPGVRFVVAGTRDYYRAMATAKYFVNNVNFPNDIGKRRGQVHLQTHHGTPLKTMGMDLADARISRSRVNVRRLLRRVERWDFSISANPFSTEIWERVYPSGTYESLETGYPRNDVLVNASAADVAKLRAGLGIPQGKTAVLYAPTHRESAQEFVPLLDVQHLAEKLGPDFVVLMRAHYFYGTASPSGPQGSDRVLDVSSYPSVEELFLASDVLVTDYSSMMFDYAVLDRPLVIYAPDWEDYRSTRGVYFDLLAEPPGAVTTNEASLVDVLRSRTAWDEENALLRQAFRTKYCSLEDGRAAERVVRRLWPEAPGPVPAGVS
ncbi:MAG: bifunctional glycosyltransferase/CDP-glycerol:glycerophosphate glycerophosphotransferase [Actinomycetes bacterium]